MFKYILVIICLAVTWMLQQLYEVHIFGNSLVVFSTREDSLASGFVLYSLASPVFSGLNSAHAFYLVSCFVQAILIYTLSKSAFFALFVSFLSLGLGGLKIVFMVLGISSSHQLFGDLQYLISLLVQFFSLPFVPVLLLFINRYMPGYKLKKSV